MNGARRLGMLLVRSPGGSGATGGAARQPGKTCGSCHDDPVPGARFAGAMLRDSLGRLDTALDIRYARDVGRRLGGMTVHPCSHRHAVHRLLSPAQRYLFDK